MNRTNAILDSDRLDENIYSISPHSVIMGVRHRERSCRLFPARYLAIRSVFDTLWYRIKQTRYERVIKMKSTFPCFFVLLLAAATSAAEPNRQELDFFEKKIRPVLVAKCYSCHSAKAVATKNLKGGLMLDTRSASLKGGESGPSVVPGKPDESLLIAALKHESFEMPPKEKLSAAIVADFVKWIEMGAPDPRTGSTATVSTEIDIEAGRKFWAFQPLAKVTPPTVKNKTWVRTPVDHFILARQQTAAVQPNATADARTLVRRVYFDLVGLPPTTEELTNWVAKVSTPDGKINAQAYAELVDHLLSSQHYGERWARHWLDLARFAESNGYAFDRDRPNAFHYRDFVIKAMNADMPYDRFVQLQLAGDLLEGKKRNTTAEAATALDAVSATGFLVAGTFTTQQTQKERERSRYEQLDDMVNTIGNSLLGMSLGCCRCHSHKYDPLPQKDYYRLVSCFADVGFANEAINTQPEEFRAAQAKFNAAHAPLVAPRTKFEKEQLPGRFDAWLKKRPANVPLPKFSPWHTAGPFAAADFKKAFDQATAPEKKVDLAATYQEGKLKWTAQPTWTDGKIHNTLAGNNAANYLFRTIDAPGAQKVSLSLGSDDAIKVWLNGKQLLAKNVSRKVAANQEKLELSLVNGRNELLIKIVNKADTSGFYFKSTGGGPPKAVVDLWKTPHEKWNAGQRNQVSAWYRTTDADWVKLNDAVVAHQATAPKPTLTTVYSAKTRGSTYNFGANTYKVFFLRRGNADNKEGEAPPGFLRVLMTAEGQEQRWLPTPSKEKPSPAKPSRIAMAEWMTDVDSGAGHLLARVMVNRLWYHHFGRGIVATPSDFGKQGERPSHPQLLDYLAGELIRGGWKLKPIHRLMMTSSVYMQAGQATPGGAKNDPENMLFWRHQSQRLEAEIIRDSLLSVSGTLDKKMYGKGPLDARTKRRSIYLTVKRGRLIPLLQLFDAPDAMQGVGSREKSTVAPQALALLNSPMVRDLATKLALRVRPDAKTPLATGIDRAYQTALSRTPTDDERKQMQAFIQQQKTVRGNNAAAETTAFRDFCHILLCSNEFVYID